MPIPTNIRVCCDHTIPVEQVDNLDALGHWDECDEVVRIRKNQPEAGKVLILMHEMIHMAETQLIAAGILGWFYNRVIRPVWGEHLVEHLASFLFQWMGLSGMLSGATPGDVKAFIENHIKEFGIDEVAVKVPR